MLLSKIRRERKIKKTRRKIRKLVGHAPLSGMPGQVGSEQARIGLQSAQSILT
jgi:hypothetical protein